MIVTRQDASLTPMQTRSEISTWRKTLRPLVRNRLVLAGSVIVVVMVLVALLASFISPHDPIAQNIPNALKGPSAQNWFGTDRYGRDVLSRTIYGSQISLWVGLASAAIAMVVGSTLGLVSGYFGGQIDNVIGRMMDILFAFPALLLAIAVASMLGTGLNNTLLAIAIVYTPSFCRIVRGPVLSEKNREYIEAARVAGAGNTRIIGMHILPNVLSPIVVHATITLSYAILMESYVSYLGLGTPPPTASWGNMLSEGRTFLEVAPWISIFPGIAIMLAVLGFNLLGDGLRDVLDPTAH